MKYAVLILTGLLFSTLTFAQTLKGKVTDASGLPIPGASVYVKETKQGLVCNAEGEFQTKLPPGTYQLEFRCVGFNLKKWEITVGNSKSAKSEIEIVLTEKEFQLPEVEVSQGEDPAYAIMRKAIAKAPYYQSVVKESVYEVYSKGSGKLVGYSKIIEFLAKQGGETLSVYKDKLFMQESVSEVQFTAPDKYTQNITAYSSTFPNSNNPKEAIGTGMISLYRPMLGIIVSPLNPKAFSYYRFRYEGYDEENGQFISKIRIIPKLKDPKLMEGIIYIADDEWNIRHAEFTVHQSGMAVHYNFNYHPVIDNIYLVANYEADMNMDMLGMKLKADFLASIQYRNIQLNDSLIAAEAGKKKPEKQKKEKKKLEIKIEDRIHKTVDSLAVKRDSVYWSEVRTVALNEEELKSYARKDTMQAHVDSISHAEHDPKFKFSDLIGGGKVGNDTIAFVRFSYSGLLDLLTEYNFVDGLWLGQSFGLDFRKKKNTGLKIEPSVYWASARKALIWKTDFSFDYAPRKLGKVQLSAGKTSEDFSGAFGVDRFANASYSLFYGENPAKFYEKTYIKLSNSVDIANGLQSVIRLEFAKREQLENHTTWNILGRKNNRTPNIPEYTGPLHSEQSDLAKYTVGLIYTPEYYYRITDGKKQYVRSRFPTFSAVYQQGFSSGSGDNYARFSRLELGVEQNLKSGVFSRFNYSLKAGKFFNKNAFNYIDNRHFQSGGNLLWNMEGWRSSFALLPLYAYSTNKEWVQAFANYQTDYLLLKRIPYFQGKMFTENLQAKFLHTPDKKYYSEWGYSVDLPADIAGIGAFVAFDAFKYNGVGIQIAIPLSTLKRMMR
jgi:hypothetical protein